MNSSISSFKNELKVFAVILITMGVLEIQQGTQAPRADGEVAQMRRFPSMADNLAAMPGTRMVLLGNSLTQTGYNMPLLDERLLEEGHADLHVENVAMAGSSPIEWYHVFANDFVRRGKTPDVIVINMSPDGIADGLPLGYRFGRLAEETNWRDVAEVLFKDLRDVEAGGQYLQARISPLYADRWDIRIGVLYNHIPDLWQGMEWVNASQPVAKQRNAGTPRPATYSLLTRMLTMARDNHARVIFVAMPAREHYDIDPALMVELEQYKVTFLDCRAVPGLTVECFKDGWHLTPAGAIIFTPYIASLLPSAAKTDRALK